MMMRICGIYAESHDIFESKLLRAQRQHLISNFVGNVLFGNAGFKKRQGFKQGFLRDDFGGGDFLNLLLAFDKSKVVEYA